MNDDWRLRIELDDEDAADTLADRLRGHTDEQRAERSLHDRIMVSVDGREVFAYAGTREQAEATQRAVERLTADEGWTASTELRHWHPTAEQWEEPDLPLPTTDAERAEELRRRVAQERVDTARQGYPDFEVKVQCDSRGEAGELAERLRAEGLPVVHRWSAVLIGVTDEASAAQLAQRLRDEAPRGATVTVEGNLRAIWDEAPWRPFSVLGGFGG